jgi:hypothetical protein
MKYCNRECVTACVRTAFRHRRMSADMRCAGGHIHYIPVTRVSLLFTSACPDEVWKVQIYVA